MQRPQKVCEAVSCHAWMLGFPPVFHYPVTLTHKRNETDSLLGRRTGQMEAIDNLWFIVLIIQEKQHLFLLTRAAQTVIPEQVAAGFVI